MLKLFSPLPEIDTGKMLAFFESMKDVVEAPDEGLIPNRSDYTIDELERSSTACSGITTTDRSGAPC